MTAHERQTLKDISICAYLLAHGFETVRTSNGKAFYCSPLRADANASFVVNIVSNTFKDFGESEKPEDVIRLVERLHGFTFIEACQHLANWSNAPQTVPFLFNGQIETTNSQTVVKAVLPLRNSTLIQYAASRGIPYVLAAQYLKEVHYTFKGRTYFALGFANDVGGFALRNEAFKRSIEPNGISTLSVANSSACSVFEGFFDFLSAIVLYGQPTQTAIVLNSVSNLPKALSVLNQYRKINTWLDRDPAGCKAVSSLQSKGFPVLDQSDRYNDFNDLNLYLTHLL